MQSPALSQALVFTGSDPNFALPQPNNLPHFAAIWRRKTKILAAGPLRDEYA